MPWLGESEEAVAHSPKGVSRLAKFRWWYVVLLVLGAAIGVLILVKAFPAAIYNLNLLLASPGFIGEAFAQTGPAAAPPDYKPLIMVAIIVSLLIILLGSVWVMLTSANADTVKAAGDLTKVLIGFFVGVATKYIGA